MRIVVNDAVEAARRRGRTSSREVGNAEEMLARLADPGAGPHTLTEAAEARRKVWRALEELSPVQRATIVQRYCLGMSEAEMAESGGSPTGTIKSRLHAARKRLLKLLRTQFRAEDAASPPNSSPPVGARLDTPEGGSDHG